MKATLNLAEQSKDELIKLIERLFAELAKMKEDNKRLREELNRVKKLKGRPDIKPGTKPSGMEEGTNGKKRRRKKKVHNGHKKKIEYEDQSLKFSPGELPPGSVFKGYAPF